MATVSLLMSLYDIRLFINADCVLTTFISFLWELFFLNTSSFFLYLKRNKATKMLVLHCYINGLIYWRKTWKKSVVLLYSYLKKKVHGMCIYQLHFLPVWMIKYYIINLSLLYNLLREDETISYNIKEDNRKLELKLYCQCTISNCAKCMRSVLYVKNDYIYSTLRRRHGL